MWCTTCVPCADCGGVEHSSSRRAISGGKECQTILAQSYFIHIWQSRNRRLSKLLLLYLCNGKYFTLAVTPHTMNALYRCAHRSLSSCRRRATSHDICRDSCTQTKHIIYVRMWAQANVRQTSYTSCNSESELNRPSHLSVAYFAPFCVSIR